MHYTNRVCYVKPERVIQWSFPAKALYTSSVRTKFSSPQSYIDRLPNETLLEIAHLLKKADLVVLSQVDRRLHALVEPLIWRELPSLVPLLQLLPPGYFFIEDIELRPENAALPSDVWERSPNVRRLASHVKKLLLHPIKDFDIDRRLDTYKPQGRSFMSWNAFKEAAKSLSKCPISFSCPIYAISSETVTTFVAHCALSRFDQCTWRCAIDTFCFYERHHSASKNYPSLLQVPIIAAIAQDFAALRVLKLDVTKGIGLLSLLERGRHTLRVLELGYCWVLDNQVLDYHLEALRSLTLEHISIEGLVSRDNDSDMTQIMGRINQVCHPDSLRHIDIHENPLNPTSNFSGRHLASLAPFVGLVEIDIQPSREALLSDADYAAMVPCWPRLRYFRMHVAPCSPVGNGGVTRAPATLGALTPFAMHCHDLHELCIQLHLKSVPSLKDRVRGQNHLYKLNFGRRSSVRPEADCAQIAEFIRSLFPNLQEIGIPKIGIHRQEDTDSWDEILHALAP
ncbi:hypothetical protein FB107DRAFT_271199 [Schizophyllum commune]